MTDDDRVKDKDKGQTKEDWRELCEQAVREKDPQRLLELVQRINQLLAEEERPPEQKLA